MTRILAILVIAVFLNVFFGYKKATGNNDSIRFSEKVNLALRRTAHHLLVLNGDSTSMISPVQQTGADAFTVKLNGVFAYDKLPSLLQQSLDLHGITRAYDVSILKCTNGELQLGYNFLDLKQKGGVPCANRTREPDCYTLKVSFSPESPKTAGGGNWWILPFGGILAGLGYLVWKKNGKDISFEKINQAEIPETDQKNQFGNSVLDMPNLILISGDSSFNLTYREAKLLNLFVGNKNQVLERDFILKSVWEDEGIIVGRSVDVFVSRLRKMLHNDSMVKIAAVHGVGYRMEVNPTN